MKNDHVARAVQARTGFLAFGLGVATTAAIFGTILLVSNDMRWVLWLGSAALFGAAFWVGLRRRGGPISFILLVLPLTFAYGTLVVPELPGLWPHLASWLGFALLGWFGLRSGSRPTGTLLVAGFVVTALSLWYSVAYVPGEISRSLNRFQNEPAPQFTFDRLDGSPFPIESLEGKVVVIDFFATWCRPCIAELPELEAIRSDLEHMDDFEILVVAGESGGDTPSSIQAFVQERGITLPFAFDTGGEAHSAFGFAGFPGLVVIDRSGHIRLRREGYNSAEVGFREELVEFIESL